MGTKTSDNKISLLVQQYANQRKIGWNGSASLSKANQPTMILSS